MGEWGTRHFLGQSKNGTTCAHKEEQAAFPTSYFWAIVRDASNWRNGDSHQHVLDP